MCMLLYRVNGLMTRYIAFFVVRFYSELSGESDTKEEIEKRQVYVIFYYCFC